MFKDGLVKVFVYIKNNSSRVPEKNFRKIGGLELWKHLIYELDGLDVYIDTDSDKVINDCLIDNRLSHVTVYKRKQEFIDLEEDPNNKISPALLMVDNFLNTYVSNNDEIVVLAHVTSPFLTKSTIHDAINYIYDGYNFVHSVHSVQDFAWLGDEFRPINFDPTVVQRTQDIQEIYFSNGAFFIFKKSTFKKYKNRIGPKTFYFKLNHVEAVEIDTKQDLEFAEVIYKGRIKGK